MTPMIETLQVLPSRSVAVQERANVWPEDVNMWKTHLQSTPHIVATKLKLSSWSFSSKASQRLALAANSTGLDSAWSTKTLSLWWKRRSTTIAIQASSIFVERKSFAWLTTECAALSQSFSTSLQSPSWYQKKVRRLSSTWSSTLHFSGLVSRQEDVVEKAFAWSKSSRTSQRTSSLTKKKTCSCNGTSELRCWSTKRSSISVSIFWSKATTQSKLTCAKRELRGCARITIDSQTRQTWRTCSCT